MIFDEHIFQTPKAESSFYDPRVTWNTADPYATSPVLKTPRPLQLATPTLNQPPTPSSQKILLSSQDCEALINSHEHYSSLSPKLSLQVVELANQLSSAPHIFSAEERGPETEKAYSSPTIGLALDISSSMQSASTIQTPPPTSTSASRRKGKQTKETKLIQQSAATARRISAPLFPKPVSIDIPSTQAELSPQRQFSAFDFSPDVFEFPMPGPSTAPAYPQQKLFWEPKDEGMDVDFPEDFNITFDTPRQPTLDPFVSAHHQLSTSQVQDTSTFLDFHEDTSKASSVAMDGSGFRETSFSTTGTVRHNPLPSKVINSVVDPSLLFSSPSKAAEPIDSSKTSMVTPDDELVLQPYAYQIQEAKREKAAGGIVKSKRRRKPDSDSPAVKAALETLRAGKVEDLDIRSSMTESIILRTNKAARHVSQASHSYSRKVGSAHGHPSLVKQGRSTSNRTFHRTIRRPPHRRTSLALTIDSNGRARTETRKIVDSGSFTGKHCMDFDDRSDQSDSDTSSDESHEALITSQAPSFAFPMEETKLSKVDRFGPNIVSHSSHSSYASVHTAASSAESWHSAAYNRSQPPSFALESVKHGGSAAQQGHYASSVSSQSSERSNVADSLSEADTIMESDDDSGSAQYELMKVLKDRQETNRSKSTSRCQPKHHLHSPLTNQSSSRFLNGISPTTMSDPDFTSLNDGGNSHDAGSIRCVCHMNSNKGQLIIWY